MLKLFALLMVVALVMVEAMPTDPAKEVKKAAKPVSDKDNNPLNKAKELAGNIPGAGSKKKGTKGMLDMPAKAAHGIVNGCQKVMEDAAGVFFPFL